MPLEIDLGEEGIVVKYRGQVLRIRPVETLEGVPTLYLSAAEGNRLGVLPYNTQSIHVLTYQYKGDKKPVDG